MGSLTPRMYVAFRVGGGGYPAPLAGGAEANTGPVEYVLLYLAAWPNFDTAGAQARGIVDRVSTIELDTRVRSTPHARRLCPYEAPAACWLHRTAGNPRRRSRPPSRLGWRASRFGGLGLPAELLRRE